MNEKQTMSHKNQAKRKRQLERSFYAFKPRIAIEERSKDILRAARNVGPKS